MNSMLSHLGRSLALCLCFCVTAQVTATALPLQQEQTPQPASQGQQPAAAQQQPATQQPASQQPASQQPSDTQHPGSAPDAPAAQPSEPAQSDAGPGFASRSQDVEQKDAQNPVGTAAGPLTRPTGVAGSRPSGAAIAPAKQRRVKAIFIRIGLIVAGAAAAGAVIGLSKGSPSHPQ